MTLLKTGQRTLDRSKKLLNEVTTEKASNLVAAVAPEFIRMGEQTFNREVRTLSNLMQNGMNDHDLGVYLDYLTFKANPQRAEIMQKQRRARTLSGASITYRDWKGFHLALVDQPAYGREKTALVDWCYGSKEDCKVKLRYASSLMKQEQKQNITTIDMFVLN